MRFEEITVQCYAGYKSNERPMSFNIHGRQYHINEIIDRWYEGNPDSAMPVLDYFKVLTDDGDSHIIRYNRLFDKWSRAVQNTSEG